MKAIRIVTLFISLFSSVHAQVEIKLGKNDKYGIYNTARKTWVLPPSYAYLTAVSGTTDTKQLPPVAYIAGDKKGYCFLDANSYKVISPYFLAVYNIHYAKNLFAVSDRNGYQLYQAGKGLLKEAGTFDSYDNMYTINSYLIKLKKDNRYAYVFTNAMFITPFEYETNVYRNEDGFLLKKKGKYGVMNTEAKILIPFEYDSLEYVAGEYCRIYFACRTKKWGVIDSAGAEIIPLQYEDINTWMISMRSRMNEACWDLLPVKTNGKWGVIDRRNNFVIPAVYDSIKNVNEKDEFSVYKDGKEGLISRNNNILFPFKFTYFQRLDTDLNIKSKDRKMLVNNGCIVCDPGGSEDGKWGITDSIGNVLVEVNASIHPLVDTKYDNYEMSATGLPDSIRLKGLDSMYMGYLWNIGGVKSRTLVSTDSLSEEAIDPEGVFYIVSVADYKYSYNFSGGKNGMIDLNGKFIMPVINEDLSFSIRDEMRETPSYQPKSLSEHLRILSSPYYPVTTSPYFAKQNGKWGMFAWSNQPLITPQFDSLRFMHIDNGMLNEMGDSLVNAKGYPKQVVQAFEGKNMYFYSLKGKLLTKFLPNETISAYVSIVPPLNDQVPNNFFDTQNYFLVHVNATDKMYTAKRKMLIYTDENPETEILEPVTAYIPMGGKLNLLNTGTFQYLFPEAVEDLKMITGEPTWYQVPDRINWYFQRDNWDSLPKEEKNNLLYPELKTGNYAQIYPQQGSRIFYKTDGKWFLYNGSGKVYNDPQYAFDSIQLINTTYYKAWRGKKSGVYTVDQKGPFNPVAELTIPEFEVFEYPLLSCKDCDYIYKPVVREQAIEEYDAEGNLKENTGYYKDTLQVPFVRSGKFNIQTKRDTFLLSQWYDEIILPAIDQHGPLSFTDSTNSIAYSTERSLRVYYIEHTREALVSSFAVRDGNQWKLISTASPAQLLDGFESIQYKDGMWEAKKNKLLYRYEPKGLKYIDSEGY